jgi:hypothetical protein
MSVSNPVIDYLDTATKRIYLLTGVREYHPVTDIYAEVRSRRRLDESLRKFPVMVTADGNVPKGGGKFTARYAVLRDGWRIVPADEDHSLYVSGEQITDDGQSGPACIDTTVLSVGTNVTIHYEPPASELVTVPTGGLTTEQAGMLSALAKIHGLVSGQPLTVTPTSRTAGGITQSITESGGTVTVERTA